MIGELENNRCYFCGGKQQRSLATLPFVVHGNVVVVKRVPALICQQCGEAIVDSDVASMLDTLLKQTQQSGYEVTIIAFEQLATQIASTVAAL